MPRRLISAAACLGFLGVAFGAFGTHGLKERLTPDMLAVWSTATQYQIYHALAMLLAGILLIVRPEPLVKTAAILFGIGVVIFSGSLYVLALTGERWLGAVTPLGGLCFLSGWACLAIGATKASPLHPLLSE